MCAPSSRPTQKKGTATPGAGRDDHVGPLAPQDARRSSDEVAHQVDDVAGGRVVHPRHLLAFQPALGVGEREARPAALVLAPPRSQQHQLREVTARGADEQDAVGRAGRDGPGAGPGSHQGRRRPPRVVPGGLVAVRVAMATSRSELGTSRFRGPRCRRPRTARGCGPAARACCSRGRRRRSRSPPTGRARATRRRSAPACRR